MRHMWARHCEAGWAGPCEPRYQHKVPWISHQFLFIFLNFKKKKTPFMLKKGEKWTLEFLFVSLNIWSLWFLATPVETHSSCKCNTRSNWLWIRYNRSFVCFTQIRMENICWHVNVKLPVIQEVLLRLNISLCAISVHYIICQRFTLTVTVSVFITL